MKTVLDSNGTAFGPFKDVALDTGAGVLRCDAALLPIAVLGEYEVVEDYVHAADPPDPREVQAESAAAIQRLLDATAQSRGYDNIVSLCSYAGSSVPRWAAEGQAGMAWRDACWSRALEIQVAVQAGKRALPSTADVLAEMPAMPWPV